MAQPSNSERPFVFLPRVDGWVTWEHLDSDDPRFVWDGRATLDLDVAAYRATRLRVWVNLEPVFGRQNRPFDLNHENDSIEVFAGRDVGGFDLEAGLHHTSRHVVDRANSSVVAWNVAEGRISRQLRLPGAVLDGSAAFGFITGRTYVDYTWTGDLRVGVSHPLNAATAVYVRAEGEEYGVDPAKAGRTEPQTGGLVEGGIRVRGQRGTAELFVGYERRIDAYPLDRTAEEWTLAGFRLGTR